jgi:antitoxin ChpS
MPTATLRTVGGSTVIAIPKQLLEMVQLRAGSKVEINVEQGHLVVIPQKKRRYMLSDLIAQCDPSLPLKVEEQEWLEIPAVGLEYGADSH